MKVKWLGKTDYLVLTNNKIYNVISIERGWYRIIDDSGDDYLYPPHIIKCFLLKIQGFLTLSVSVNKPELRTFRCIWY